MKGIPGSEPERQPLLRRIRSRAALTGAIGIALVAGIIVYQSTESRPSKPIAAIKKHHVARNYLQIMRHIQSELNNPATGRQAQVMLDESVMNPIGLSPFPISNNLNVGILENAIQLDAEHDAAVDIEDGKAVLQPFIPHLTIMNYPPNESAEIGITTEKKLGYSSTQDVPVIYEAHTFGNPSSGEAFSDTGSANNSTSISISN